MSIALLPSDLRKIFPTASAETIDTYLPWLTEAMAAAGLLDTIPRAAAFLAQIGHESVDMRYTAEIGGIHTRYAPWFGRGLIQITWQVNYKACGDALGQDFCADPWLLTQPEWAVKSAVWFWQSHGLSRWADADNIDAISRKINGGDNGLQDRRNRYARAVAVLSTPYIPEPSP